MPGRLIMDQQAAIGSSDLKKDRSKAQEANLPPRPDFDQHHSSANGTVQNGISPHPTINGQPIVPVEHVQPPQLDQSWRESVANKSMGKMVERLAYSCFEELSTHVRAMAEQPMPPSENGALPRSDEVAIKKKHEFMQFAHDQRDRFIKTLVLSDWARNTGEDMAKLVDLKVWQEKQFGAQLAAMHSIGNTKHTVAPLKMPNPNIEGALQVLSTGKAPSKVPDGGFIPPKRLTARQLLRTLQDMNVMLTTRLNVHEDLPPYLNNFTIANGRATFCVPSEFEVDLSIADQDVSSPFYFIDMRFIFSPAPKTLPGNLRGPLEMHANAELATKGLQGCYDLLHNVVLTHKLTTLKDQAHKLIAEKWFGCLGVEWKNRVLTLNYWRGQPGKKSWLEFGIGTGKKRTAQSRRPPTPLLEVRWFRKGQLLEHGSLDVDWSNLNAESILSRAIAKHTTWLLTQTKYALEELAGTDSKLEIDLATSETVPEDCILKLRLPSTQNPLSVSVETATGWISLSPSTERVIVNERGLNHDAHANASQILAYLLCKTVEERVGKAADLAGWSVPHPRSIKQDNFRALFGNAFKTWKPYICSNAWSHGWIVLATYSLAGETWWVAHVEENANNTGSSPSKVITTTRRIPLDGTLIANSVISRASLLQIEELAAAEVSFTSLSQELASRQIPHRLEKQRLLTFEGSSPRIDSPPTAAMFLRGDALLKDFQGKHLVVNSIKVTHQGLIRQQKEDGGQTEAQQQIRLSVDTGKLTHLKEFLAQNSRDANLAMTESGALAIRLRTPFGQPYCDNLLDRLQACERLDHYLAVLRYFKFECTAANLHKLNFTYSRSPELSASFTFARGDGNLPARLRLEPVGSNPHSRTKIMLERLFNRQTLQDSFNVLCRTLFHSVGIMRAFERMEAANRETRAFSIHPRNPLTFTLTYQAPLAALTFWMELIDRRENGKTWTFWKLKPTKTKQELSEFEAGKQILELSNHRSKEWHGFGDGTFGAGSSHAMEEVLDKVNNIMRKSTSSSSGVTKHEGVTAPDIKPTNQSAAPKQQPPQQKSAQQKTQPPKPYLQHKSNGPGTNNGARMMTVNANATRNTNTSTSRNNQANKIKKEVIELD